MSYRSSRIKIQNKDQKGKLFTCLESNEKANGRALTVLNHLNSMEMNMGVQCTPAAGCPLYKWKK